MPYSPPPAGASNLAVAAEDVLAGNRSRVNFHGLSGVTVAAADDSGTGEVDVTITGPGTSSTPVWGWNPRDQNLLGWNFQPIVWAGSGANPTAGQRYYMKLPILETVTLANVCYIVNVAGSGATLPANVFFGVGTIASGTWTRIGQTADQSTAVQSTGFKSAALTVDGGQSLTVTGGAGKFLYVTFVIGTQSTTQVSLARMATSNSFFNLGMAASDGFLAGAGTTGNTTLATTQTLSSMSVAGTSYWVGVS